MELDLPSSPPPVEDILAARRAKRQAILAKYVDIASASTGVSPSPGPSSAVQPPNTSFPVSNPVSQTQLLSATGTSIELERPRISEPQST
jgi:serine/threonine-protein kinase PRP4